MRCSTICLLLTGCALAALSAPAWAQEAPPVVVIETAPAEVAVEAAPPPAPVADENWTPSPFADDGQSAYGLYLSGRMASLRGDQDAGARLLTRSHALAPDQALVGEEAFRAGLFSGDLDAVVRLAPFVDGTPLLAEAGRLSAVVQQLRDGRGADAYALLRQKPFSDPYGPVSRYLTPAVAAAAGDWDAALQPVQAGATDPAALVLRDQRAQLLEHRRRFAEAEAEYQALLAMPDGATLYRVHYGAFLERRGRSAEALQVYDAALTGPAPDPRALAARTRMQARGPAPAAPGPVEAAASALAFAAMETSQVDVHELSAIYLRLAAALNADDSLYLRLGQALASAHQPTPAREAFAQVGQANPIVYASAQLGLGASLSDEEREAEALEAFRRADAAAPEQVVVSRMLAGQYFDMERYDEALAVLNRPTVNAARQSVDVRFLRGAVLERMGRVDEAEAELWAALQMAPDNPVLLNHLGYLWVDSGRRVEQGAEMIARAHAADPRNANIQDSLGWAQYRRGQYETAVETLEQAVAKEPANAEIVDHLGDAYWQVGRRREAGWQWSRVLTLDPEPERRAEVEQKLTRGLPAAVVVGSQP